ncbi:MAG: hypothetical protein ACXQS8_09335 [Candidatus Helarchaeales archaeon]
MTMFPYCEVFTPPEPEPDLNDPSINWVKPGVVIDDSSLYCRDYYLKYEEGLNRGDPETDHESSINIE